MKTTRNERRDTYRDIEREQRLREQRESRGSRAEARRLEAGFTMLSGEGVYDDEGE